MPSFPFTWFNLSDGAMGELNAAIGTADSSLVLKAGRGIKFPSSDFIVRCENEDIHCATRTTDTLSGLTRGYGNTTAAAHAVNVIVFQSSSRNLWQRLYDNLAGHTHPKADIPDFSHTHAQGDVTNLVSDLAGKEAAGTAAAAVSAHAAAADPHTGYQTESEKAAANGYAGLGANSLVPTAQLGSGTANSTTFLRGDQTYAAPGGGGFDPANLRTRPFAFTDFLGAATADTGESSYAIWDLALIGAGTQAAIASEPGHPGILRISSSTTANSGGFIRTDLISKRFNGGDSFEFVFQPRVASNTNTTIRGGFLDTATSADVVDGAYFELPAGTLNIVGKTANNSVRSTTATIATLTVNLWYRCRVEVNSALNLVTFTVWNEAGTQLGQQTLSTNIPIAAAREFGHGVIATNSGTTATLLAYFDYLLQWQAADLTR